MNVTELWHPRLTIFPIINEERTEHIFINDSAFQKIKKSGKTLNYLKENHKKVDSINKIKEDKKSFLQLEEKSVGFLNLTSPKLNCACKFVKDPNDDGLPKFIQTNDHENFRFKNFEKNEIPQKKEQKENQIETINNFPQSNKNYEETNDYKHHDHTINTVNDKSNSNQQPEHIYKDQEISNKHDEEKLIKKDNIKEFIKNEIAEMLGPSNKANTFNMLEFKEMKDKEDFKVFKMNKLQEQLNEFNLKKKVFQNGIYDHDDNNYPSFFPSTDFALYQKYKKMKEFYKRMNYLENDFDLI